jgi:hypothetical protein
MEGIDSGVDKIACGTFFERRNKALDPQPAIAVDDLGVLRSMCGLKAAVFHSRHSYLGLAAG